MNFVKKFFSVIFSGIFLLSLTACNGSVDETVLDSNRVMTDYTAVYKITTENSIPEYENIYTVSTDGNVMNISSLAELPYTNTDENGNEVVLGTQSIKALQKIAYTPTDNATFGMPLYSSQEFTNSAVDSHYTSFTFEHDHALKSGLIKTRKYSSDSDSGFEEKVYSVKLAKQYFDKDALPFILASFPKDGGVILLSSGNRDRLQAVKYEFIGEESIETESGIFVCDKVLIRPNTVFTSSKAYIWLDTQNGLPIKVESSSSVMLLKSVNTIS